MMNQPIATKMPVTPIYPAEYRGGRFSQYGEEGVIRKILDTLLERDSWSVEFGAWDGMHLSVTRSFILDDSYSAVLIEANRAKFQQLCANYKEISQVHPVCQFVGFTPADSLDDILSRTPCPKNFDFLVIDIDGNDYHVWQAFSKYRPKVVCIEFNPTIPTEVEHVQPADPGTSFGSSLRSMVKLGKEKGYELVAVVMCNAFFVDAKYFSEFGIADNRPEVLRTDTSAVTWLYSGYDGEIRITGCKTLPWHNIPISEGSLQQLPKWFRENPVHYKRFKGLMFALRYEPKRFLDVVLGKLGLKKRPR
jgi:hypothetical protein